MSSAGPVPPTRPQSPSDPFYVASRPVLRTASYKRPANLHLPSLNTVASRPRLDPVQTDFTIGPPSPAPFVGFANPQGQEQWAGRGPVAPPSPFGALGSPYPSMLDSAMAGSNAGDDAMDVDAASSPRRLQVPSSPLGPTTAPISPSADRDRLSPYAAPGNKRPSLNKQLFGKGAASERGLSPGGFPFPLTPPLTPPFPSTSAAPIPNQTPVSQSANAVPPTPPDSLASLHSYSAHEEETVSARLLSQHNLHPRFASQYTILGELGAGGFGFVVRAIRNADKRVVAVKFIFRDKVPSHGWVRITNWDGGAGGRMNPEERLIPMEAYVLRHCRHEGIVGFIDLFEADNYFYLVMEHHGSPWQSPSEEKAKPNLTSPSSLPALAAAAAGNTSILTSSPLASPISSSPESSPPQKTLHLAPPSANAALGSSPTPASKAPPRPAPMLRRSSCDLFECIEQHTRFSEDQARYIFAQIVDVCCYLQSRGICHRDIKDENIVVDKHYRVKLIDFGSAVLYDPHKELPLYNRFWGTMNFASSEILQGKPYRAPPAEVWALGVLLHILLTGETPFADPQRAMVGKMANSPSRPKLSAQCNDLLKRCLDVDPERRIDVHEMQAHPWLAPSIRGSEMGRSASMAN